MNGHVSRTCVFPTKQLLGLAVTIFVLAVLASCRSAPSFETCDDVARATTRGGAESSTASRGIRVQRVIDGDTIVMADGARVRYIGMDTPERGEPSLR